MTSTKDQLQAGGAEAKPETAAPDLAVNTDVVKVEPTANNDADVDAKPTANGHADKADDEEAAFYTKAQHYWDGVAPTIDGMLGGFAPINHIDIRGSLAYLQSMYRLRPPPQRLRALDCGAGIGRVTKFLLAPQFVEVDAVEQCAKFAGELRAYVDSPKLRDVFNVGLQEFAPAAGRYDLIWSQWVLGHLVDGDLVAFFRRCRVGLAPNGIMIVKENVTSGEQVVVDGTDSSVTRPLARLKELLAVGGWRVVRCTQQHNFPTEIFPVYMITARPM